MDEEGADATAVLPMRDLHVELPAACTSTSLDVLLPGILLPRCTAGATLAGIGPMCGRGATCKDVPVANVSNALSSPTCGCTGESYQPNGDDSLSAYDYDETHGCLISVRASALERIVRDELVVSLVKNQTVAESQVLNLTLILSGTDWQNGSSYTWSIAETSPAPWLHAKHRSGSIDLDDGTTHTGAKSNISLLVQSAGLRDGCAAASPPSAEISIVFTSNASVPGIYTPDRILSMVVKVYVMAAAVASTSSFGKTSARAFLGTRTSFAFVARDIDGLPMCHGEDRFSATLTHETAPYTPTTIAYVLNGTYTVSGTPWHLGVYQLQVNLEEDGVPSPLPSMMVEVVCRQTRMPLADGASCGCIPGTTPDGAVDCVDCKRGTYKASVGVEPCTFCGGPHVTSPPAANASASCVCAESYFNDTSIAGGACVSCPKAATCSRPSTAVDGVTLANLNLNSGYWRLSEQTQDLHECAAVPHSPCLGGVDPSRYCEVGYNGPLCESCAEEQHYLKGHRCQPCKHYGLAANALPIGIFVLGLCVAAIALRVVWRALTRHTVHPYFIPWSLWNSCGAAASQLDILPKLKLLVGYYQVVIAIPMCVRT